VSGDLERALLVEDGRQLYEKGVNRVLAGFQLMEDWLKTYLQAHFDLTRTLLAGRLHFEFRRDDYQEAALGRLTQIFSRLCANSQLVTDLRAVIKRREHIAHRALLKLYNDQLSPEDYSALIAEVASDHATVASLLQRLNDELGKLVPLPDTRHGTQ
jgi:hypothetical protein